MENERIWLLMARKLAGEASVKELQELETYFRDNPDIEYSFALMKALKDSTGDLSATEEDLMKRRGNASLDNLLKEEGYRGPGISRSAGRVRILKRTLAAAASAALLIWAGRAVFPHLSRQTVKPVALHEIITKNGSRSSLVLPDGSRVKLNAGSRLQYGDDFLTGKREVSLSGEAFFEVVHDSRHPFIIHCRDINIEDLGTAFNVRAYPEEDFIETSVVRGKVEINYKDDLSQRVILTRDQKVTVYTKSEPSTSQAAGSAAVDSSLINYTITPLKKDPDFHAIPEISWTSSRLIFRQETLKQISTVLERWYNVTIHFENDRYEGDVFTGEFKDQSIKVVMHALQLSSNFRYRIEGQDIFIW